MAQGGRAGIGISWGVVMVATYCPHCWHEMPPGADRCDACGASLDETDRDIVMRYADALRNPETSRAGLACTMLAKIADPRAVRPLMALIERRPRDFGLLCTAVESLATFQAEASVPVFEALLRDRSAAVPARVAALQALVSYGGEIGAAALTWAVGCDRPALRATARENAELRGR